MRSARRPAAREPSKRPSKRFRNSGCPRGYCDRKMVLARLGITDSQFRSLTRSGLIEAEARNGAGLALYSEASVATLLNRKNDGSLFDLLPSDLAGTPNTISDEDELDPITSTMIGRLDAVRYSNDVCLRVFKLLAAGTPLTTIVIETKLHPQVVKAIQNDYNQLDGSIFVPKTILDAMNKVTLPGNFPLRSATDILEVLRAAEQERICPECEKAPSASACGGCMQQHFLARLKAQAEMRAKQAAAAADQTAAQTAAAASVPSSDPTMGAPPPGTPSPGASGSSVRAESPPPESEG